MKTKNLGKEWKVWKKLNLGRTKGSFCKIKVWPMAFLLYLYFAINSKVKEYFYYDGSSEILLHKKISVENVLKINLSGDFVLFDF